MTTNCAGAAEIYTFPPRGRFAANIQRDDFTSVANVQLPQGAKVAVAGSGWYHDEAIEAEQGRKVRDH
jgi:Protein of unknown function (DUF2735)